MIPALIALIVYIIVIALMFIFVKGPSSTTQHINSALKAKRRRRNTRL